MKFSGFKVQTIFHLCDFLQIYWTVTEFFRKSQSWDKFHVS